MCWHTPTISAFGKWRQEDQEFKVTLSDNVSSKLPLFSSHLHVILFSNSDLDNHYIQLPVQCKLPRKQLWNILPNKIKIYVYTIIYIHSMMCIWLYTYVYIDYNIHICLCTYNYIYICVYILDIIYIHTLLKHDEKFLKQTINLIIKEAMTNFERLRSYRYVFQL